MKRHGPPVDHVCPTIELAIPRPVGNFGVDPIDDSLGDRVEEGRFHVIVGKLVSDEIGQAESFESGVDER